MPKKTKKQKMAALQRRQVQIAQVYKPVEVTVQTSDNKEVTQKITQKHSPIDQEDISVRNYFIKDLRKSLFLIGCIIVIEFFFYSATIGNYLSKYLKF